MYLGIHLFGRCLVPLTRQNRIGFSAERLSTASDCIYQFYVRTWYTLLMIRRIKYGGSCRQCDLIPTTLLRTSKATVCYLICCVQVGPMWRLFSFNIPDKFYLSFKTDDIICSTHAQTPLPELVLFKRSTSADNCVAFTIGYMAH